MDCTRLLASVAHLDARLIGDQEIVGFVENNSELFSIITKTSLFKYTENFTTKNLKIFR